MSYFCDFFFSMWLMGGREVCTSGPITNEQASRLVLILSRFLTCVADQIRLASEKFIAVSERFKDQVLMLEVPMRAVAAPMSSINAIAVEAFKKYILVYLIQNRQFSTNLPKYTSSVAQRNLKTLFQKALVGLKRINLEGLGWRVFDTKDQVYRTT